MEPKNITERSDVGSKTAGSPGLPPSDAEFLKVVREVLASFTLVGRDTIDLASTSGGAYALLFHLDETVTFTRKRTAHVFASGWYVYAGNAYGPGGIRARVGRHFRRDKLIRWHIDHLTRFAGSAYAVVLEHGAECEIVADLLRSGVFRPALAGFGSTDCRTCPAHLLERS